MMAVDAAKTVDGVSKLDLAAVRRAFPQILRPIRDRKLVYLDSAATALKPQAVIDAVSRVYVERCANVHRGVHLSSALATADYEAARETARAFIGASRVEEIVFLRGTTEAINLVAHCLGRRDLGAGDEVLITGLEHHSNIVPWQMVCEARGAKLVVVPVADDGTVSLGAFEQAMSPRTKIVSVAHVSNALGTILPVSQMVALAKAQGAYVVIDGAQAAPHLDIDVISLDCDFYALSSHKVFGPSGVGLLYGRYDLLADLPPYQGGGDMIRSVSFEKTEYAAPPARFEAGTPNIEGAIGFGAALAWLRTWNPDAVRAHEADLLAYGTEMLSSIPGVRLIGTAADKVPVLSFVMDGAHPHDIGTIVDAEGVAIRTGHHCAQPLMQRFAVPATARASLALYNSRDDLDALGRALERVREMFS